MSELPIDPRDIIAHAPMSRAQKQTVALTALLSALDGFDVLSITFVAPVLGETFHVGSAALGLLLSSGLLGMLVGSWTLAAFADVLGRRPVALISLAVMAVGMLGSAFALSLTQLVALRLLTGIGIGAMVVVINPIAVEFSNLRNRAFALAMMSIGFPLGGMVGGMLSAFLLRLFDWQAVFLAGAALAALLGPLTLFRLPESLSFLIERKGSDRLARINALLTRFGHQPIDALPTIEKAPSIPYRAIFQGKQLIVTVQVAAIGFLSFFANYYFLSWHPKLLVDLGFTASSAASVSGISSLVGACSCAAFGLIARQFGGERLAVIALLGLGVSLVLFGITPPIPALLIITVFMCGACLATATVGLYVIAAGAFEPHFRATGTGFIIGIGRIGAALAPSIAGSLFQAGGGRAEVSALMGVSAFLAGFILIGMRRKSGNTTSPMD